MAAIDIFPNVPYDASNPYTTAFAIVPNDNQDIPYVTRAIVLSDIGTVTVIFKDDDQPVTLSLMNGFVYPFRIKRVLATGTTVTSIIGLV